MYRDKSIPPMETVMSSDAAELDKLQGFLTNQIAFEEKVKEKHKVAAEATPYPNPETDCKPPRSFKCHIAFLCL